MHFCSTNAGKYSSQLQSTQKFRILIPFFTYIVEEKIDFRISVLLIIQDVNDSFHKSCIEYIKMIYRRPFMNGRVRYSELLTFNVRCWQSVSLDHVSLFKYFYSAHRPAFSLRCRAHALPATSGHVLLENMTRSILALILDALLASVVSPSTIRIIAYLIPTSTLLPWRTR